MSTKEANGRVAFVQILPMWLFHDSLLLIVMPRYLLSVSVLRTRVAVDTVELVFINLR